MHRFPYCIEVRGTSRGPILLCKRGMLLLRSRAPMRVTCQAGCLWITQLRGRDDIVLLPGQSAQADRGSLIQALHESEVQLSEPMEARGPAREQISHELG